MKNEKQMTAVKFMYDIILSHASFSSEEEYDIVKSAYNHALQMEREQIEKACSDYNEDRVEFVTSGIPMAYESPTDYYEKTYGGGK